MYRGRKEIFLLPKYFSIFSCSAAFMGDFEKKNTGMFHGNLNLHVFLTPWFVFQIFFSSAAPKDKELNLTNSHLTLLYLQEFLLGFNADFCG